MNYEILMILLLVVVLILPKFTNIEKFSIFDHKLYYPDVDCLYTKNNSCIIKPNNYSFYDYNNLNCKQKFKSDEYYKKINSTCIDCVNKSCNQHKPVIEKFDGRCHYDRKKKIFYKTISPGIYKNDVMDCPLFHIKENGNCRKIIY